VIGIAGPDKFAHGGIINALAAVIVCTALGVLLLGAFSAIRGRRLSNGSPLAKQTGQGSARRLGLAQVLFGTGALALGLQPFLLLTWLSRTILLSLAAMLITAGAAWMAAILLRADARNA
jgi:MFS family permease